MARPVRRRTLLHAAALTPLAWTHGAVAASAGLARSRVRPGDPSWPSADAWRRLNQAVGGRLIPVQSPLAACRPAADNAACAEVFHELTNPYFIGDNAGLTETSGWADAWTSSPSAYAVAARKTADVVAAVKFARAKNLRLVVKGGGHSYQGTSNAPDSLMVWTRAMRSIQLHDGFIGKGCAGRQEAQPAVSIETGARWREVYQAVMVKAGRYVQGGGCMTVGVAGLIQSGGFGSFSKRYGLAAAGLLEAEIVTADGMVRIANACSNPDLFWGLKGGGGGTLGVVTRITLRTRQLPDFFGGVAGKIRASSDAAFRRLIDRFIGFYATALFNPHWGEQVAFERDNTMSIGMVFQGLDQRVAETVWQPFLDFVTASPADFTIEAAVVATAIPARHFFDADYMGRNHPSVVRTDDRTGAPASNVFWSGDAAQVGFFLHGYDSLWLPGALLRTAQQPKLADALFAATRQWTVQLHFNKGLAGAPSEAVAAARDTAANPAAADAFALAIISASEPPAFVGIQGHEPNLARARDNAAAIGRAIGELARVAPERAAYLAEGNYFDEDWQRAFWGANYPRLASVKQAYDPEGLFFVHHGAGSEAWSADGFTRVG